MRIRKTSKRAYRFERLEDRRLLVGEGDLFQVQRSLPNAGLLGDVAGELRWGDGSTAPLVLSGDTTVETSGLKIVIDYSLDDNGFFDRPGAKPALRHAANLVASRFQDQLAAIKPNPPGLPGLSYRPFIQHPSKGPSDQATGTRISVDTRKNVLVKANEIRLFAGGRYLRQRAPDGTLFDVAAFGGPGDIDTDPVPCIPDCATVTRRVDEFKARGQTGAIGNNPTDSSLAFAQISFNTTLDWSFAIGGTSVDSSKVDFLAIAVHELAHVFGLGTTPLWLSKVQSGRFTGANARAAYQGSGTVPLAGSFHWANSVFDTQPTLMTGTVQTSKGRSLSTLDFAALKDLGWQVRTEGNVSFNADHRYLDNGVYDASIVLRGSNGGEAVYSIDPVIVENLSPTLSASQSFSVPVGVSFQIENLGRISDPGAEDTFSYQIDWGDDSATDTGSAVILSAGDGAPTEATFGGSHSYDTDGVKTVAITATDNDGATATASFQITVTPPPTLTLSVNRADINEEDGTGAATLTIRRSGPVLVEPQRVNLQSSDTSELTIPASVEIPAGATEVMVPIDAVDDDLLDGLQSVNIVASGTQLESDEISITVNDRERLIVRLAGTEIIEGGNRVNVRIERSNTDVTEPLSIDVSGLDRSQLDFTDALEIPAGASVVNVRLLGANDEVAEAPRDFAIRFSAAGYASATETITLIDDEPPAFQNFANRFDVNGESGVTAIDALIIINAISRHGGRFDLDPGSDTPGSVFLDVSGDYRVSALDALQVINELSRQQPQQTEGELLPQRPLDAPLASPLSRDRLREMERNRDGTRWFF